MIDKKKQGAANREWGKMAEDIAAEYLLTNGYIIRERNWRIGNKIEIDIIAEKDGIIVFVEVRGETYTCAVCLICFLTASTSLQSRAPLKVMK